MFVKIDMCGWGGLVFWGLFMLCKVDILVMEFFGLFGDNELLFECLDGI